eukprot:scaffold69310_cov48-Attheya_sp.AAC.10
MIALAIRFRFFSCEKKGFEKNELWKLSLLGNNESGDEEEKLCREAVSTLTVPGRAVGYHVRRFALVLQMLPASTYTGVSTECAALRSVMSSSSQSICCDENKPEIINKQDS